MRRIHSNAPLRPQLYHIYIFIYPKWSPITILHLHYFTFFLTKHYVSLQYLFIPSLPLLYIFLPFPSITQHPFHSHFPIPRLTIPHIFGHLTMAIDGDIQVSNSPLTPRIEKLFMTQIFKLEAEKQQRETRAVDMEQDHIQGADHDSPTALSQDQDKNPSTLLTDAISKPAAALLGDIDHHFVRVSGLPVIDTNLTDIQPPSPSTLFSNSHDSNGFIFDEDDTSFPTTLTTTTACSRSNHTSDSSGSINSCLFTHAQPPEAYNLNLPAFYYTTFSDLCHLVDNQPELWCDRDFTDAYELAMDRDTINQDS